MSDVVEISSDSDDTIIIGISENLEYENINTNVIVEEHVFRNKYSLDSDNESLNALDINTISNFDSKFDNEDDILKGLCEKYKFLENRPSSSQNNIPSSSEDFNYKATESRPTQSENDILKDLTEKYNLKSLSRNNSYSFSEDLLNYKSPEKCPTLVGHDVLNDLTEKHNLLENVPRISKNTSRSFSEDLDRRSPKKRKTDNAAAKLNKELIRQEKERQRIEKKQEIEREKTKKKALATNYKNLKPEECIKFITVHLDVQLLQAEYAKEILTVLQSSEVFYKTDSNIFPNTVTWSRRVESSSVNDTGTLIKSSDICEADELLLVMNWKEFIDHVNNQTLTAHIQSLKSVLYNKKVSLTIYGLAKYFKFQQNLRYQAGHKKPNKANKIFENCPKISRRSVEFALTELQLLESCSYRMVENETELGEMVFQFTKAIAQLPYKLQKQQKHEQAERFLVADNKDCVRVDKNGNGLCRLWHQVLVTFPMARLETAEAISLKYPTPLSLMEAYECCSKVDGEKLLQDIPIRRAAGPSTSIRKIGPELSKKIYNFFTSLDGDILL